MEHIDLISQSALLKHRQAIMTPSGLAEYVPVAVIREAELIDAEEVIRCRNCFWFLTEGYDTENADIASPLCKKGFCFVWKGETRGDQYCSRARLKRD